MLSGFHFGEGDGCLLCLYSAQLKKSDASVFSSAGLCHMEQITISLHRSPES